MARFHHLFDERDSGSGIAFNDIQDLSGLSNHEWVAGVSNRQQKYEKLGRLRG